MITLRVVGLSVSGGALAERDAVPDGDLLGSDEDVFDEQPQDAAALVDGGGLGVGVQCGEEAFRRPRALAGKRASASPHPRHRLRPG
jgi:hypothetical protein